MEIDYVKKNKGGERKRMFVKARIVKEGGGGGWRGAVKTRKEQVLFIVSAPISQRPLQVAPYGVWWQPQSAVAKCQTSTPLVDSEPSTERTGEDRCRQIHLLD